MTCENIAAHITPLSVTWIRESRGIEPLLPGPAAGRLVGDAGNPIGAGIAISVGEVATRMDGIGVAGVECVYTHELPALQQKLCSAMLVAAERQVVRVTDHETMGNVVIGARFLGVIVVLVSNTAAIVESQRRLRLFIDRLAPGVGAKEAQAVGKALLDLRLQAVICGAVAGAPVGKVIGQKWVRAAAIVVNAGVRRRRRLVG